MNKRIEQGRMHILFEDKFKNTVGTLDNWIIAIAISKESSIKDGELEAERMIASGALIPENKGYTLTDKGVKSSNYV